MKTTEFNHVAVLITRVSLALFVLGLIAGAIMLFNSDIVLCIACIVPSIVVSTVLYGLGEIIQLLEDIKQSKKKE